MVLEGIKGGQSHRLTDILRQLFLSGSLAFASLTRRGATPAQSMPTHRPHGGGLP
jgi:hypothetical protein